jgi:hypothetical protein
MNITEFFVSLKVSVFAILTGRQQRGSIAFAACDKKQPYLIVHETKEQITLSYLV